MATLPYFVLGPSTLLSLCGFWHGRDKTAPTPAEDWRTAAVDLVIPALNEADNIVACLASVLRQTVRPRRIVLIDDGSSDGTVEIAKAFCASQHVDLMAIHRRQPIGKTPTIKRQARELDSDVEFILDGDTVLESDNYIERVVQELYQAVGIASACGTILPQRRSDRRRAENSAEVRAFNAVHPRLAATSDSWWANLRRGVTNVYREVLYLFLQRVVYRGQMAFFGTTTNPVGCAVAYRRKYVRALFDYIGPILGDDLTNSEDIFIGFSMLNEGYRNIQLTDVYARTAEPEVQKLPRQVYLWSSSFLQCCYYFDPLVRSPLRSLRRWNERRRTGRTPRPPQTGAPASLAGAVPVGAGVGAAMPAGTAFRRSELLVALDTHLNLLGAAPAVARTDSAAERRVIREPYRQAFGRARTESYGRPAGWILLMSAVEKVFFPTVLLILLILRHWEALALTVAFETAVCVGALAVVMKGQRLEYVLKGLAVTPIRYALLASELITMGWFAFDVWITKNRRWRK